MVSWLPEAAINAMKSQLFAGGAMLAIMGSAIAWGRKIPSDIYHAIKRRFVVQVDIVGTDPLFGWFTRWLDAYPQIKRSRLITASSSYARSDRRGASIHEGDSDEVEPPPEILFAPAPGRHFLWIKRRPVMLTRERKEAPGKDGEYGGYFETYTLRAFGRSNAMLKQILEDARDQAHIGERRVSVYGMRYGDWRTLTNIQPRPIESVFLPDGQLERIIHDLQDFLGRERWYTERGIPWRRSHMYEGPPGTGKSSAVSALAGHLRLNLYICAVGDKNMTDERLLSSVQDMRTRSILLLEDVDAVVAGREVAGDSGVTFAGLLNALDGVTSKPGVVTIMTTNHPERLDPALVRKGRVDLREHFGVTTAEQAARLYQHFYRQEDGAAAHLEAFTQAAVGRPMSDLQAALLDHKHAPADAVAALVG